MTQSAPIAGDGALLAAFRAGDKSAFEGIVRLHYRGLVRVAEQRCGARALAEDAVQNALVRAHRYLRANGSVENLGAWLRRIVYNCATDLLKSERRREVSLDRAVDVAAAPETSSAECGELEALVRRAIDSLAPLYRKPLKLRYLHGVEAREIAQRLGDNLNSIKSRLARGRRELRRKLEPILSKGGYLK